MLRAVAVSVAVLSVGSASSRAETITLGSVQDMPAGHIVVTVSTELVMFEVARETTVTLNGQPANAADLRPGDHVRISTHKGVERFPVALSIVAVRGSPGTEVAAFEYTIQERGAIAQPLRN
jgi:hypothetical protein